MRIHRDRSGNKENAKNSLASVQYCSLKEALTHNWAGMTRRQTKELNPAVVFAVLGSYFPSSLLFPFLPLSIHHHHHLHLHLVLCFGFADRRCAAIWEFQAKHQGKLPSELEEADELEAIANKMIKEANVNKQILTVAPRDLIE